jgi:hypothetical protein
MPLKRKCKKKKSIATVREDLAKLLQKLVRMKAADENGYCRCVTCNKSYHWKQMQGGHFIERGRIPTKIVEENIHPQCEYCNQWGMKKASVVLIYREYMVDTYGSDFVDELIIQSNTVAKHSRGYLEQCIDEAKSDIEYQLNRIEGRQAPQEAAA